MKNGIGAPLNMAPGGLGSLPSFDVLLHDIAGRVDIISVQSRGVILVFLNDLVAADRRVVAFPPGRYLGYADKHVALVKIGPLFLQINFDRGRSLDPVSIPIGDWVIV